MLSLMTASRIGNAPTLMVPMSSSLVKAARISAVVCDNQRLFWIRQVMIDANALLTVSEPAKIKILYNNVSDQASPDRVRGELFELDAAVPC